MKNVSLVLLAKMELLTKILSASVDLFRQYGFKTITMDDIARRAGISKKTLYQHFANKNEVVMESVSWYQGKLTDQCENIINTSDNAIEVMVRMTAMFDHTHKQMNPIGMLELQRYFPETYEIFRAKLLERDVELLRKNIEHGMSQGLYRAEINADIMARFRIEASLMMFQPNLLVNDHYNLVFVSHELAEHFLYGLMTPKGEKIYQKFKKQYLTDTEIKQVSK